MDEAQLKACLEVNADNGAVTKAILSHLSVLSLGYWELQPALHAEGEFATDVEKYVEIIGRLKDDSPVFFTDEFRELLKPRDDGKFNLLRLGLNNPATGLLDKLKEQMPVNFEEAKAVLDLPDAASEPSPVTTPATTSPTSPETSPSSSDGKERSKSKASSDEKPISRTLPRSTSRISSKIRARQTTPVTAPKASPYTPLDIEKATQAAMSGNFTHLFEIWRKLDPSSAAEGRVWEQTFDIFRKMLELEERNNFCINSSRLGDMCLVNVDRPEDQHYQKDKELGQGAFGTVYLVKVLDDQGQDTGKRLALKEVSFGADDSDLIKNSVKEIIVMIQLRHQNVIRLVDFYGMNDQGKRALHFYLELADAGALSKLIRDGFTFTQVQIEAEATDGGNPIPPEVAYVPTGVTEKRMTNRQIRAAMKQIIQGVAHMHSLNLIHRDLKPDNVLITSDGTLKIADFGTSTWVAEDWARYSAMTGTPSFMSPEISDAHSKPVDIWSIGMILYTLVEGTSPHTLCHFSDLFDKIRSRQPPAFIHEDRWTEEFKRFFFKCLDLSEEGRVKSAVELVDDPIFDGIDGVREIKELLTGVPEKEPERPVEETKAIQESASRVQEAVVKGMRDVQDEQFKEEVKSIRASQETAMKPASPKQTPGAKLPAGAGPSKLSNRRIGMFGKRVGSKKPTEEKK